MRHHRGGLVPARAMLPALVITVLAGGCSADPPPPRWREVTSGRFTGAHPRGWRLHQRRRQHPLLVAGLLDPRRLRALRRSRAARVASDTHPARPSGCRRLQRRLHGVRAGVRLRYRWGGRTDKHITLMRRSADTDFGRTAHNLCAVRQVRSLECEVVSEQSGYCALSCTVARTGKS